jgi:hypothetical protein
MILRAKQLEHDTSDRLRETGNLHFHGVRQGQQPVHCYLELFHAAPTAKVASVKQDIASRHSERLRMGI